MEELIREPLALDVQTEVNADRATLAQKAKQLFGYEYLNEKVMGINSQAARIRLETAAANRAFKTVGIEPFSKSSVERYKRSKVAKLNARYAIRNFVNSRLGEEIMGWSGFCGIILCIAAGISLAAAFPFAHRFPRWSLIMIVPAGLGLLTWWSIALVRALTNRKSIKYEWRSNNLRYTENVPDFALAHAVALKEELPDATFTVDWLGKSEEMRPTIASDPFLVMHIGSSSFFADVWDEKDFEKKL